MFTAASVYFVVFCCTSLLAPTAPTRKQGTLRIVLCLNVRKQVGWLYNKLEFFTLYVFSVRVGEDLFRW